MDKALGSIAEHGFVGAIKRGLVALTMIVVFFGAIALVGGYFMNRAAANYKHGLTAAGTGKPFAGNFQPGDCSPKDTTDRISCAGPHDKEIYAVAFVNAPPTTPFPGTRALKAFADENCEPRFEEYAGATANKRGVRLRTFVPTPVYWEAGVRQVLCLAEAPGTDVLSGPLRAA